MPKNQFVKGDERAKAAGRKGGPLGGRPAKLNLKRVEAELPPLDSLEHAMARLDLIGKWALAGMVAGTTAGAGCERHACVHLHPPLGRQPCDPRAHM